MKRPEILLVNPWIHDFAAYNLWSSPMGLLVLATRLRQWGWEPRLLDCLDPSDPEMPLPKGMAHGKFHRSTIPKPEPLLNVPRKFSRYGLDPVTVERRLLSIPTPKAILVTGIMTYWYTGVQETVLMLRQAFPDIPVIVGGVYATLMPDHAARACRADEVIDGPGEERLPEVLYRLTGVESHTGPADLELEFAPALDLLGRVGFLPLLTSRGCPLRCSYCASRRLVPGFVRRSPALVVQEIETAVRRFHIIDVALYDDAFLVDSLNHALPILNAVSERVPGLRWHSPNGLHASAIDLQVAKAMKKAGFKTIRIGLESSSDEFHARTGGKTTRQAFVRAVGNLREAGFSRQEIGAYLLVGLPGQSRELIERDVDLVIEAGALPKLAEYSPIPGTVLWESAVRKSRFDIAQEPLFHNCTLLAAAEPGVDWNFLNKMRSRIHREPDNDHPYPA